MSRPPLDCDCGSALDLAWVWDGGQGTFAHNVYGCESCGSVTIVRVWRNPGRVTVRATGSVIRGDATGGGAL